MHPRYNFLDIYNIYIFFKLDNFNILIHNFGDADNKGSRKIDIYVTTYAEMSKDSIAVRHAEK